MDPDEDAFPGGGGGEGDPENDDISDVVSELRSSSMSSSLMTSTSSSATTASSLMSRSSTSSSHQSSSSSSSSMATSGFMSMSIQSHHSSNISSASNLSSSSFSSRAGSRIGGSAGLIAGGGMMTIQPTIAIAPPPPADPSLLDDEEADLEDQNQAQLSLIDVHELAEIVRDELRENMLIVDSRSFLEYNTCHIARAINLASSKIVKRRLQQDKMSVKELLRHACHCDMEGQGRAMEVIVYDQTPIRLESIAPESFLCVLLSKLAVVFASVRVLVDGFLEFRSAYPDLVEDKSRKSTLTTLSQPCISISNTGPTKILPFLYLGSQQDVLNRLIYRDHNITYVLNVSVTCPKPDFIQESHFMRIPVNDNFNESLLQHLPLAVKYLDKVRESGGCALVHCLAGMSRSATVVIAYVMRHMKMSSEEAYRYVKGKRSSICPNFNFLGQLLEYEKQLRFEKVLGPINDGGSGSNLSMNRRNSSSAKTSRSSSSQSLNTMTTAAGIAALNPPPSTS